ncbi:MAG: aminotransferase class V-fold PLP-dependent enzyme [Pyrinomonadaceae bacterium]
MTTRRSFLTGLSAGAGILATASILRADSTALLDHFLEATRSRDPEEVASDERIWADIRKGFDLPEGILNLDNGYSNPLSRVVMNDLIEKTKHVEQLPGKRVESLYDEVTVPQVIAGLGRILGVPADELGLVRNATEALDTVILGLTMKPGDEILCCTHDYYAMLDAIEQRRKRDGISVKILQPPAPARSLDALADLYVSAITPRTKLVLVTHASNMTGQIYPVKQIAAAAHKVGAEVLVDGAQTMALVDYLIPDLDCDYYGASLHKWLMGPVGAGVLWMRKQNVPKIWPLVPSPGHAKGMMKYSWSGTYPEFISASVAKSIEFHEKLGASIKEARLRYLTLYWRQKVEPWPGVKFYTSKAPEASCGLGIFEWNGVDLGAVQKQLWEKEKILVQFMTDYSGRDPKLKGLRVTPNIYNLTSELDLFVSKLMMAAAVSSS